MACGGWLGSGLLLLRCVWLSCGGWMGAVFQLLRCVCSWLVVGDWMLGRAMAGCQEMGA